MAGELHYIKNWAECADHLDMLISTIRDDLFPLRRSDQGGCTVGGAPHTISREFSCYVDYIGALYTGWPEWNKSGERFVAYRRDALGQVNHGYAQHADLIREMYRNGPVHEFDPKVVFNSNGDQCGWLESVGSSPGYNDFGTGQQIQVSHLTVVAVPGRSQAYYLPVFTSQLLDDLIQSIELFRNGGLGNPSARTLCWDRAVGYLIHPVRFNGFRPPTPTP